MHSIWVKMWKVRYKLVVRALILSRQIMKPTLGGSRNSVEAASTKTAGEAVTSSRKGKG